MATFDEFYKSLDPDSGIRGKQFEKFVKWFLKTDPEWQSQVEEVWLWDEYPERWGRDCGIDLIFKHKNGKTWAVQSKCYSPENDISKSEIDSFLSESSDARIDGRLLIASTDGIGRNALQVIERQEKQVVCFLLNQFRQSEIEYPESPNDLSTGRRKDPRTPRPHQIEAIDAVEEGLKDADRGQLLMACGTGKTLTSLWIKERLKAQRTLVLLPSLSLLSQTLREWSAAASEPFEWICVCSDKSVAKQDKTEDDWITNLSEMGVPVSSNPEEIRSFLKGTGLKIVFSTYQSSPLVAEAQKDSSIPKFDLTFADEAHRCAGKVSDAFGCVLDEDKIQSHKRLFLTATPRVLSSQLKSSAAEKDIQVASMDDHSVFGKVLYEIKFSKAIERDLLSDYQVVVVGVDDDMIRNQIENRDLVEISSNELKTDAETLAAHIALAKATNEYDLQRVITFHGLVKGAKNFAENHKKVNEWMNGSGESVKEISAAHVSGDMNSAERNKRIDRLKNLGEGERGILTNARCLSEGVDVPTLDGIAFIDPRQSQVDIIQAVGRAIRKSENKTFGTIVIPVYLSEIAGNINDQVLASKFSAVWKIILALKSQDDSLMEEIDTLRVSLGQTGTGGGGGTGIKKVIVDLPEKVSANFSYQIRTLLIRNASDDWLEKYGKLKDYLAKNEYKIPQQRESSLGAWCGVQRTTFKKGKITQERIDLLESLEGWTWDPFEEEWQSKFKELKEYSIEHGRARPAPNHFSLGSWVVTQRKRFMKGKITQERIDLLESLEGWTWDPFEEEWQSKFKELKEYAIEHGHPNVPLRESSLGKWCGKHRIAFKKGKITQERIDLLESIEGWTWDPLEEEWQSKFRELKEYAIEHKGEIPNYSYPSLGGWIATQRKSFKQEKITQERIDLLESIEGWEWIGKSGPK